MRTAKLYYFSGTGNSLRLLEIGKTTLENKGYTVSVEEIRAANHDTKNDSADLLGFFYPVYGLAAPRIIRAFMEKLPGAQPGQHAFLLASNGGKNHEGFALTEPKSILEKKSYTVMAYSAILMPNNWVVFSDCPSGVKRDAMLLTAEKEAEEFFIKLTNDDGIRKPFVHAFNPLIDFFMKYGFRNFGINLLWRHFSVDNTCTLCGRCAKLCPTRSITLKEGRPQWHATCEQCMRCITFCPTKAIGQLDFIFHTKNHVRYHEPHFNPSVSD
ncbi:MAG: 4Fe-4S dicluster domain-containing protein [Chitinivibrionales bacterium]|nr:4Fe-4S dicluster domain-containing protein [Chitinivibrionales bacterium]